MMILFFDLCKMQNRVKYGESVSTQGQDFLPLGRSSHDARCVCVCVGLVGDGLKH